MSRRPKSDRVCRRKQVFLVDWHALMRSAVAEWINRSPNLEVCGAAGDMSQAFRAVERLRPDVVVSEIMRPHDLGFIRQLHRRHPRLPILVFTIQDAAEFAARTREAGASGYLMKRASGDQLIQGIRAVLRYRKEGNGRTIANRSGRRQAVRRAETSKRET
jgi:two-component system invasion response regulator UvrY